MQVVTRKHNVWEKKNATSLNSQSKIIATIMVDYNEKYLYRVVSQEPLMIIIFEPDTQDGNEVIIEEVAFLIQNALDHSAHANKDSTTRKLAIAVILQGDKLPRNINIIKEKRASSKTLSWGVTSKFADCQAGDKAVN